jgi:hypothetical protein
MTHTITRLFDTFADAEHAVIELERVGVPRDDISLVAHQTNARRHAAAEVREPRSFTAGEAAGADAAIGAGAGGVVGAAGGALAGLGLIAIPGLGPVVAAGWLAALAVGAVAGGVVGGAAGGIIGALTNAGVSEEEAHVYAEGVRRGGTLVSAKVADGQLGAAQTALNSMSYVDISQRGAQYRAAGWTAFDPAAPAYTPDEVARERAIYVATDTPRPLP